MKLLAADIKDVFGEIKSPAELEGLTGSRTGAQGLSYFFSRGIELLFAIAGLVFVFMVIFSAFQWITSGGDKEALSKAKGRLTSAIIGIILLAVAFLFLRVLGQILGFSFFTESNSSIIRSDRVQQCINQCKASPNNQECVLSCTNF